MTKDLMLFDERIFINDLSETNSPLSVYKNVLKRGNIYLTDHFLSGSNIQELVEKRVWLVDELLNHAWIAHELNEEASLIAVGGYGRGELHPSSDIDLLILIKSWPHKAPNEKIQKFLTFLWDIGLDVGQSVRSIGDCIKESKADITVITNMMESRLLSGSNSLYEKMLHAIRPERIWPARKYFISKTAEQKQRHAKYNETEHNLEPNIKEGPGGLRDIHMISWVTRRFFKFDDLHELVKHEFLTETEYQSLINGQNLLWKIRFALHHITGRCEDRLLFEHQKKVANILGFHGEMNKDIELFMKMYYQTVRELNSLNDILLRHFEEAILYANKKQKLIKINKRFNARNNLIEAVHENTFSTYPFAIFEIFLILQQHKEITGIRANTIRMLKEAANNIDDDFRNDIRNRSLFIEIMRERHYVGHVFRSMHRYGVLGAYIPAFAVIQGLMQFDLFHVYTVDEHTLVVIKNMRLFINEEAKQKHPVCHELIKKIPKPELLYISGLFHDIAKGRGGDHSSLGAVDALAFCEAHDFSAYDSKLVAWLVDKHLLMSQTAQKQDIDDEEVILKFLESIPDQNHLNYLYLLTVADICGTNPAAWNKWKQSLLSNLYHRSLALLRKKDSLPQNSKERIASEIETLQKLLDGKDINANDFLNNFEDDYTLRHTADEIAWHIETIHEQSKKPSVALRNNEKTGATQLFVHEKDRPGIFMQTCRALERLNLNIHEARIITTKDNEYTFDTYAILEQDGSMVKGKQRNKDIIKAIKKELTSDEKYKKETSSNIEKRKFKNFKHPTQIDFNANNNYTMMEISTIDQPGLLHKIGLAMEMCGVNICGAKIATFGEKVEDIFYITDKDNQPIQHEIKFDCIRDSINDALG